MHNLFSKQEYESSAGTMTSVWGPLQWSFMHIISFNYPVNPTELDKDNYNNYLMSLKYVLPCKACRLNLSDNLITANYNRDKLKNRESFSKFIYNLHNIVNKSLNKKNYATYEEVRDIYELFRAKCIDGVPLIPIHKNIKLESGCVVPLNNVKTQCIIHIVPQDKKIKNTFIIDKKCIPSKIPVRKSSYKKKSSKKSINKSSKKKNN